MIRQQVPEAKRDNGFIIPAILSLMVALSIITGAVVILIDSNFSLVGRNIKSQQAFNVAEAGINYYLWHLSHNATDYKDGKTTPATPTTYGYGPYVHNYVDSSAKVQGTFTLYINPIGNGSTIVKVRSIGQVTGTNFTRTVEAQIGAPSFASYAVASDEQLWFGNTEAANGPIHSNQGIRMDGASNSDVTSSNATYVPDSSYGGNGSTSHPGVWCDTTVLTPVNCNTRPKTDWRYPVPTIDFNQLSGTLCTIKKLAFLADAATSALAGQANACSLVPVTRTAAYLPQRNSSYSLTRGYLINLNPTGRYDLYQVNAENDKTNVYTSALTTSLIASNITVPASGVIYAEDNVWVRSNPTYTGRLTIAAGRLATANGYGDIVIADDLVYGDKTGVTSLGLIAQDSVIVAPYAPPTPATTTFTFEVDGALIAQNGTVAYPSRYRSDNTPTQGWVGAGQQFNFYGSIGTRQNWTWTIQWGSSGGNNVFLSSGKYISGILNNTTQYDYNLLYTPPPNYPITSSYNILSWREVLVSP